MKLDKDLEVKIPIDCIMTFIGAIVNYQHDCDNLIKNKRIPNCAKDVANEVKEKLDKIIDINNLEILKILLTNGKR